MVCIIFNNILIITYKIEVEKLPYYFVTDLKFIFFYLPKCYIYLRILIGIKYFRKKWFDEIIITKSFKQ